MVSEVKVDGKGHYYSIFVINDIVTLHGENHKSALNESAFESFISEMLEPQCEVYLGI